MSLRDLAAAGGVRVGAAVNDQIFGSGDKHYRSLLADEFNSVTAERAMKWLWIHPEPDRWDWEASDELVEFADAHQMQVRGHTVVWPHWGTPDYITQCADADALRQHLVDHVRELFSHWEGSVARVDVVNEPLHWLEGRPADSAWRTLLGEDYLADVLTVAHEADSTIELWINETHTEVIPDKHALFTRIVADLVERGSAPPWHRYPGPPALSRLLPGSSRSRSALPGGDHLRRHGAGGGRHRNGRLGPSNRPRSSRRAGPDLRRVSGRGAIRGCLSRGHVLGGERRPFVGRRAFRGRSSPPAVRPRGTSEAGL